MVKPATPLTFLLFVAFALQLLSVLSVPIIRAIPLASFAGFDYGVFGFCKGDQCSGIQVGYPPSDDNTDFSLPSQTRRSLPSLLIVHPIAAFLTLVCTVLAAIAHLHSAANSSRYLLALIILLLPTLLASLLAFLVDILLFVPRLSWGGWIVLAATIIIAITGIFTCAMRRTMVSRKVTKKRLEDNVDMNGSSFYGRQNGLVPTSSPPPFSQQPTSPTTMVNGAPGANSLPSFATFDQKQRISDEDRIPLNSRGTTTVGGAGSAVGTDDGMMDRYGAGRGGFSNGQSRGGGAGPAGPGRPGYDYANPYGGAGGGGGPGGPGGTAGPRDEYGNPLPPSAAFGRSSSREGFVDQYPRRQHSNETMNSQYSRGGRGGYPPRGYSRGGRGVPYGRGGAGGAGGGGPYGYSRALAPGPAGGGSDGMSSVPPPQYGYSAAGPNGPYARRTSPGPPSAPGYGGRNPSPGPPSAAAAAAYGYDMRQPTPVQQPHLQQSQGGDRDLGYARAESPPPLPIQHNLNSSSSVGGALGAAAIGQAVEMDASTGSPAQAQNGFDAPTHQHQQHQQHQHQHLQPDLQQLRGSDSDVQGLVGLQQGRAALHPGPEPSSPSSAYSSRPSDSYIPPRAGWGPPSNNQRNDTAGAPAELSAHRTPPQPIEASSGGAPPPSRHRASSENYYEDVDPRFSVDEPSRTTVSPVARNGSTTNNMQPLPTVLVHGGYSDPVGGEPQQQQYQLRYVGNGGPGPGPGPGGYLHPQQQQQQQRFPLEQTGSYDSTNEGPESDASNFTSVSQREINPQWGGSGEDQRRYGPGPPGGGGGYGIGGVPNRTRSGGGGGGGGGGGAHPDINHQREMLLSSNPDFEIPGGMRGPRMGGPGGGGGPGTSPPSQGPGPGMGPGGIRAVAF